MTPSPKQTVQVQSPTPPQLMQRRAERGSTSVLIRPPPPHIGQPIFLNPLHNGHSTMPPCINLTSYSRLLHTVARFCTISMRKVQEKNASPASGHRTSGGKYQRSRRKPMHAGSGSFCQRSFTELVLRLFGESTLSRIRSFAELTLSGANVLRMTGSEGLRVTVEGFRMTSLSRVILSGVKNLYSYRASAHNSQTDPLPACQVS